MHSTAFLSQIFIGIRARERKRERADGARAPSTSIASAWLIRRLSTLPHVPRVDGHNSSGPHINAKLDEHVASFRGLGKTKTSHMKEILCKALINASPSHHTITHSFLLLCFLCLVLLASESRLWPVSRAHATQLFFLVLSLSPSSLHSPHPFRRDSLFASNLSPADPTMPDSNSTPRVMVACASSPCGISSIRPPSCRR